MLHEGCLCHLIINPPAGNASASLWASVAASLSNIWDDARSQPCCNAVSAG